LPPLRLEATVIGRVQGVGFRASVQWKAHELGLTGYVRNLWDDNVEVVAEGPEEDLRALLDYIRQGPRLARVDKVNHSLGPASGEFQGFRTG